MTDPSDLSEPSDSHTKGAPCQLSKDHVVPLTVQVGAADIGERMVGETPELVVVGIIAEKVAQKWGYRPLRVCSVESNEKGWLVEMEVDGNV